jgi:agmatinase
MDQRNTHLKDIFELLTIPGNGVFTVNNAKEKKQSLLFDYYGTEDEKKARAKWVKGLQKLDPRKPWIIGIPSDNGGGIQRGANWGPLVIRKEIAPLKDSYRDLGDVRVIPHLLHDKYLNDKTIKECRKALFGRDNKLPVSPLSITEKVLSDLYGQYPEARILGLGGDHSVSYPLVKAWLKSRRDLKKAAVLHFDAHTDLLDKRLGIDLCFGTWTYHILNELKSPNHIIQVGIRSSGKTKKHWKKTLGVEQIWSSEVTANGAKATIEKISRHFKKIGIEEIYISFDIDAIDEKYAAATGTPEKNGLIPTDCVAIIKMIAKSFKITGADLMELAPFVIPEGVELCDQRSSIKVAGDIARTLLDTLTE